MSTLTSGVRKKANISFVLKIVIYVLKPPLNSNISLDHTELDFSQSACCYFY